MFDQRSAQRELLDQPNHDRTDLRRTLGHMDGANRWLGGFRSITAHIGKLFETGTNHVLDVGTGSADIPRRLTEWGRRTGHHISVIAVDAQTQIAREARRHCSGTEGVYVIAGDGRNLPLANGAVDVALSTLTLHHMNDEDAAAMLAELARVSRRGVIISDLERHPINYWGARAIAATAWRASPYAQDGPISVLRSFRRSELHELGVAAGLRNVTVHRHFPYRLALVGLT